MGTVWVNDVARREIERGGLHIYSQNIMKIEAEDGEWVEIRHDDETLAFGFYSSFSSIPVKVYSYHDEDPLEIMLSRMDHLYAEKRRLYRNSFRWVFAEGDLLPGLIVDVYNDIAVFRIHVRGLENMKSDIVDYLSGFYGNVVERNDSRVREKEGLPLSKGIVRGREFRTVIEEGNATFVVDTLNGHKTGFYLDQRENRIFSEYFGEGKILDVFSYTGGFGIHMGLTADEVTFVEMGETVVNLLKENITMNGVKGEVIRGDAVKVLEKLMREKRRYDVISLDPPSLAKDARHKESAKKMYFLLNRLAMRLLESGGVLLSSSCTHFLTPKEFLGVVKGAAEKENRRIRMLGSLKGQAPDHTVYLPQPETLYLKHGVFVVE